MGDIQFWLYVIIGVIYVISRMLKKPQGGGNDVPADIPKPRQQRREATQQRQEHREVTQQREPERQPTFEELLREIMEGKPEPEPEIRPVPPHQRPVYKNYDEEIEDEAQSLEDVDYDHRRNESVYSQYEGSKPEAFTRRSLEETMTHDMTDMSYGKFKAFDIQESRNLGREYLQDLNDPETLKKAFVMSEILKRKF